MTEEQPPPQPNPDLPKPSLKLTPKPGLPPKPGEVPPAEASPGKPKFRVTRSPFAPKIASGEEGTETERIVPQEGAPGATPPGPAPVPGVTPAPEYSGPSLSGDAVPSPNLPPVPAPTPAGTPAPVPAPVPAAQASPSPAGPTPTLEPPKTTAAPIGGAAPGVGPGSAPLSSGTKPSLEAPKPMVGGMGPTTGPGAPGTHGPGGTPSPITAGGPPPMGAPMGGIALGGAAGAEADKKSGPSVVMVIIDTICFLAAATFAVLLYMEFDKTL